MLKGVVQGQSRQALMSWRLSPPVAFTSPPTAPTSPALPPFLPALPGCKPSLPSQPGDFVGAAFQAPQCYVDVNDKRHCLVLPEGQTVCDPTIQRRIERHLGAKLASVSESRWVGDTT